MDWVRRFAAGTRDERVDAAEKNPSNSSSSAISSMRVASPFIIPPNANFVIGNNFKVS